jgi:hypothetical protein
MSEQAEFKATNRSKRQTKRIMSVTRRVIFVLIFVLTSYGLPGPAFAAPPRSDVANQKPLHCPPAWRMRGGNSGTQLGDGEPIGVEPVGSVGCFWG